MALHMERILLKGERPEWSFTLMSAIRTKTNLFFTCFAYFCFASHAAGESQCAIFDTILQRFCRNKSGCFAAEVLQKLICASLRKSRFFLMQRENRN